MMDEIKNHLEENMGKVVENLKYQITKLRTGRAQASLLDGVTVDYYGTPTPLSQVGQISTPEARLLHIRPFDKTMMAPIEKAILGANLGLTPSSDGNFIRIPFPALTEERRKEQVKELKKMAEEARVGIRNSRRNKNDEVKKAEKDKNITEDDVKKYQGEIQTITDKFIKKIDEIVNGKEQEILTI